MTAPFPAWPRDFSDMLHRDHDAPADWHIFPDVPFKDEPELITGWMAECRCGATKYIDIEEYRRLYPPCDMTYPLENPILCNKTKGHIGTHINTDDCEDGIIFIWEVLDGEVIAHDHL